MVSWPGAGFGAGIVQGGSGRNACALLDVAGRSVVERLRVPVLAGIPESLTRMTLAGLFLVGLGLAAVLIWRSGLSAVVFGTDRSATSSESAELSATESPATSETPPAEEEATAGEPAAERTDREVVVDILDDHDGRMKQALIVDETGWSKSKVSMLLSDMEDDGDISKLRVGRENIISLSGNEPEAAGSPFDDE